jgi:predicted O-linked N-acetylglucosamine transferase (SPINDLY family)
MCSWLADTAADRAALSLLAEISTAAGKLPAAVASLRRLAALEPHDAAVHRRLGNALLASGSLEEAESCYRHALELEPASARGHNNLGQALLRLGRHAAALERFRRALEIDPAYPSAHHNSGVALLALGACEEALGCFDRALELDPALLEAHRSSGDALQRLGRYRRALECYRRALELGPDRPETLSNCASALLALRQPEEALRCCERALALKPDLAEAHSNLGGALRQLQRFDEAAAACERALALKPDFALALSNLADVRLATSRAPEARDYCERALALAPGLAKTHELRALALLEEKRPQEAAASYARLLEIDPHHKFAAGAALGARMMCCEWRDFDGVVAEVSDAVAAGRPAIRPFTFLGICDSPPLLLRCARTAVELELPQSGRLPWNGARYRHDRIRIAYLSADFHQHATALLSAGLFEAHDRERFEITAVSFGPDDGSGMRRRLLAAFDRFLDVQGASDAQVVEQLRSLEIDIAVDLKGYTAGARSGILARRAAPLQVSYLGYPGSMGLPQIDYLVADPIVLPAVERAHYSEQVVYLPDSYQVNDERRAIAAAPATRAAVGLPEDGLVFCCFNQPFKITPAVFELWMRLLREVPASVLWLLEDNAAVVTNLRREALARGVAAERLVFARRLPPAEHLARHHLADLFLDTLPYNAHTTASDALWAGLPVLTCLGHSFPGRVAASLLHAVGLPELVTRDLAAYHARALELATDPRALCELRQRLATHRGHCALFDTQRFCRHLEDAYTTMWRRHQQDLAPASFVVEPRVSHKRHASQKRHPLPAS